MSSFARKIRKNKPISINTKIKFSCRNCNFYRIISEKEFKSLPQHNLDHNKIFYCEKCNLKMGPTEVIVDY